MKRAQDFGVTKVLLCWRAGIEAEVNNPAIRDALWFGLYTGMCRDEVLTLRWERVEMDALTLPLSRGCWIASDNSHVLLSGA